MTAIHFFEKFLKDETQISLHNDKGSILYNGTAGKAPYFLIKNSVVVSVDAGDEQSGVFIEIAPIKN